MEKSITRIALVALVAVAAVVSVVGLNHPASASPTPTARSIAPQVESFAAANTVKAIGIFASANQATLSFQAAGRVKEILVKEGERVRVGATMASLDTSVLDLQVTQAQAALDTAQARFDQLKNPSAADIAAAQASVASADATLAQLKSPTQNDLIIAKSDLDKAAAAVARAQADYDRIGGASNPFIAMSLQALALQLASLDYQKAQAAYNARVNPSDSQLKQAQFVLEQARSQLARLTSPSVNDLKTAQAAVAQAQAALDLAKQNIANAKIVAPFDGTVLWIASHIGESAAPGTPAITFADLSRMQVVLGVDEVALASIKVGQLATISADALPGRTLTGHVSKIGLLATTTGGVISTAVTIDIDSTDAPIFPGLSATVEISLGQ